MSETKKDSRKENRNAEIENVAENRDENYEIETSRKMVERMTADSMFFHEGISYTPNESLLRASDDQSPTPPMV